MKCLSLFLIAVSGLQQPTPNNPEQCFARDIDIDGNLIRSNVIEEFNPVYSAAECQHHCQQHRGRGCAFFVWEANDFDCTLYSGLSGLEYDQDDQAKWLGPVDNCIGCHREGWDYIQDRAPQNNLVGNGNIDGVSNVYKCAEVCQLSADCYYVSFNKDNNKCYLKTVDIEPTNVEHTTEYQSTMKGCTNSKCVQEGSNYPNGWFARYDVITRLVSGAVPGVSSPHNCHKMCQAVTECGFWTWDKDDNKCYLVKTQKYLEPSDDKISGSSDCVEFAKSNTGSNQLTQFNQFG